MVCIRLIAFLLFVNFILAHGQYKTGEVYFYFRRVDVFLNGGMYFIKIDNDSVRYYHFGIDKGVEVKCNKSTGKLENGQINLENGFFMQFDSCLDEIIYKDITLIKTTLLLHQNDVKRISSWEEHFYKLSNEERLNVCLNAYEMCLRKDGDELYIPFVKFKKMQETGKIKIFNKKEIFIKDLRENLK